MAKLKAHGQIIGQFEYVSGRIAVMSDGHVLRNTGGGWKLFRKAKPGITAQQILEGRTKSYNARREACPSLARYVELLAGTTSLENRYIVETSFELLGTDLDGVWAELNDHGIKVTFEDVQELAEARNAGQEELKAWGAARARQEEERVAAKNS